MEEKKEDSASHSNTRSVIRGREGDPESQGVEAASGSGSLSRGKFTKDFGTKKGEGGGGTGEEARALESSFEGPRPQLLRATEGGDRKTL